MLSTTLLKIERIAQNNFSDEDVVVGMVNFLKHYKKNSWLYHGTLKRKFSLSLKNLYQFLYDLENEKLLESYYELYCSHCQKPTGDIYKSFNKIPEYFECELCNEKLSGVENAFIIYKVIWDE